MFHLCSKMKWAQLPVAGGLYDQDPDMLRKFEIIFTAIDKNEKQEQEKREQEAKRNAAKTRSPIRRGGRRR